MVDRNVSKLHGSVSFALVDCALAARPRAERRTGFCAYLRGYSALSGGSSGVGISRDAAACRNSLSASVMWPDSRAASA